jgi:hypothetical protein
MLALRSLYGVEGPPAFLPIFDEGETSKFVAASISNKVQGK